MCPHNNLYTKVHSSIIQVAKRWKQHKHLTTYKWVHKMWYMHMLLSRFSRVWLCATPEIAAHQAPPSLGFSRQEHWSGLPFPSPMQESEKWKWSRSVVSEPQRPHGLQPSRLLHPWDFPGKSTGVGCHCLLRYIHITEYYSAIKRNKVLINATTWIRHENTVLSERTDTKGPTHIVWFNFYKISRIGKSRDWN